VCLRKSGVFEDVGSCCKNKASGSGLPKCIREGAWKPVSSIFKSAWPAPPSSQGPCLSPSPMTLVRDELWGGSEAPAPLCLAAGFGLQTVWGFFKGFPHHDSLHVTHLPSASEKVKIPGTIPVLKQMNQMCFLPFCKCIVPMQSPFGQVWQVLPGNPLNWGKESRCFEFFPQKAESLSLPPHAHIF